eukprot:1512679-Rhodomonas_salina.4
MVAGSLRLLCTVLVHLFIAALTLPCIVAGSLTHATLLLNRCAHVALRWFVASSLCLTLDAALFSGQSLLHRCSDTCLLNSIKPGHCPRVSAAADGRGLHQLSPPSSSSHSSPRPPSIVTAASCRPRKPVTKLWFCHM